MPLMFRWAAAPGRPSYHWPDPHFVSDFCQNRTSPMARPWGGKDQPTCGKLLSKPYIADPKPYIADDIPYITDDKPYITNQDTVHRRFFNR